MAGNTDIGLAVARRKKEERDKARGKQYDGTAKEESRKNDTSAKSSFTKSGGADANKPMSSFLQNKAREQIGRNRGKIETKQYNDVGSFVKDVGKKTVDAMHQMFSGGIKSRTTPENPYTLKPSTTTIYSDLSDEERNARIKEIDEELKQLNINIEGRGRAMASTGRVWQGDLKEANERDEARKSELVKEKKELERVGTFTASELVQFKIDDAKGRKAMLPPNNYTPRILPGREDEYEETVKAHHALDEEIKTLEREKELYDNITKFGKVVNEDDFTGQWESNYRSSALNREADKAMSQYLDNPTEENKKIAFAYDALAKEYAKNNEKALDDENVKFGWLSKSAAGYLPQFKDQMLPELLGGALGFTFGGQWGAPFGAALGTYSQNYDVIRGSVYRTLLAEGVDEEIAKRAAEDEALISTLIESGETALSWVMAGGGKALRAIGNAAKASVAKGSTNAVTKFVAGLASKAAARTTTKAAATVAAPLWKTALRTGAGIIGNAFSEYGEEYLQQGVSIANKERAMSGDVGGSLISEAAKTTLDAVTGNDNKARAEMHEAGKEGFKIGLMFGGANTTANNVVTHYANAKTIKEQNEYADAIIRDEEALSKLVEEGKASGKGTVSEKLATEIETARESGKEVSRDKVKKLIESNEIYIKAEEQEINTAPDTLEPTVRESVSESKAIAENRVRLEALSQNNEEISVEDVKKVTGFGESGAQLVADYANVEGETFSKVESEVKPSYFSGFNNPDLDAAKMPSAFKTEIQMEAYKAGQIDRNMQDLEAEIRFKNAVVNMKSGFIAKDLPSDVTQSHVEIVDKLAKALGVKAYMAKGLKGNAEYNRKTGEVPIDFDFEREIGQEGNRQKVSIVFHAAHEIALHRVVDLAPKEGSEFVYALYRHLAGNEPSVLTLADQKRHAYDAQGVGISLAQAMEEVSANNLLYLYGNDETRFNNAIDNILNGTNEKAKQGLRKYIDYLTDIIRKIRDFLTGKSAEERAKIQPELDEITRLRDMFETAFAKAVENKKAIEARDAEIKTSKNLEIKVKEDYNDNASHSLKNWRTDLNARQYRMVENWIRQVVNHDTYRIADTDGCWYKGRIDGKDLFVIYSTATPGNPTILYERKGDGGSFELDILMGLLEEIENGKSVNGKSAYVNWVSRGGWMRIVNSSQNNTGNLGGGGHNQNAGVLPGQSQRNGSPAFWNVIENLRRTEQKSYSLKDNKGNTLTEAQQEYFKDTKVVDENGNLQVMYQGSAEDFTVFDRKKSSYANLYGRGFYFTKSENHASQYGKTRAFYLNIKHPVSTTETTITKSQLRKFLEAVAENEDYSFENYGYGATVDSVLQSTYGKSDFLMLNDVSQTAIGDLVEAVELFNEVNGTDYDGIILDTETVIFNSEQAKLTTNEKPTSNPDINFSLKQPVEETKNLIAVHNMQVSELERTLDLGGLPMPSIAIIKAQSGHSEYGDVSLIFSKDTIDPKRNKDNKVYGGDAWTPTYPTIEYKPNEKIANKISDKYYEFSRKFGYDESRPLYSYVHDLERLLNNTKGETAMLDELYNDTSVMQFYLLDSGKGKVETINKETRTELTDAEVKMHEFFIKELGADVVDEVKWDGKSNPKEYRKNYMSKYEGAIREAYKKLLIQDYKFTEEEVQNVLDSTKPYNYLNFVRDAQRYRENGRVTIKTEADYEATQKAIKEAAGEDYRKWVDSLFKGIEEKSGIRNNLSYYTNSGNARSWEVLHWENNLENVVKVMKSQDDTGGGFFGGQGIWGASAKNYRSIEEIKADSDRLKQLPEEEYQKIKDGFGDRMSEIAHSIMSKSERNPFIAVDNAMECIVDAVRNSKTKSGILNNLKQYPQLTVTETTVDDIVALVSDISNMPTEYFEAKPKRVVELNEIATAVIPDNTSQTTKARLDDMGIRYVEYETGNENARLEALNSIEDVQFSLKGTNNGMNAKDRKDLLDIIEHLKGEFEVTKFPKADPKKLAKMTRDILKEYSSHADYDETFKAIDELYQYMANGEDEHPPVWDDVYRRAYKTAQEIVKNALTVDDSSYQEYKPLREYLRTTRIKFYEGFDSVPSAYENFNEFRKKNMGRLNFTNDGRSIDSVYQELSSLYPEFFDEAEQTNSADQLERIVEVLDSIRVAEINPFDGQIEEVSMHLANDLTSRFFDIPQAKPTFADKAERRVVEEKIKGGKKVEAVIEQKNEKIQKLIKAQREKTKKQLDRLREQRDTKVKKEREKRRAAISKMSESQKVKVLRAKIIKHTGELNKTLLKANDKKHIPPELEGAVLGLLYNINMESNYSYDVESGSYKKNDKGLPNNKTQAFLALKEVYAEIARNKDYGLTIASELFDETGEGVRNIFDEVMKLSDKKIADMTSEELTKIYDAIRIIEHSIATANKMFAMQKWESLTETAKAFEKSVATRRGKNPLKKNYTIDLETPITFFSHFGEAGQELYEALRKEQDNGQTMIDEISKIVEGIVSLEEVQQADKEIHKFTTSGGKKLTLTKAQIMNMYLLYNRKQGRKHLLYDPDSGFFGKGVRQPEIKGEKIGRGTENIRLTKADLGNILSKLSKEDKAIADKMQKATLKLAEWGNKACMEVFGYEKFNDPNYWTIKAAPEGTNKSVEKNKNTERSIKNMGSAKNVDDKATNALEIGGLFDVFNQHVSDMICYSSWLAVVEDATKLYNYTLRDENGKQTDVTFQDLLNKYAGTGGSDYYFNLLSDIQNGIGTVPDTKIERIYTRLYGAAAKAKVAFKATVVAQQPMSVVRASIVLNPLSIIQATIKGGANLPAWSVSKLKNLVSKEKAKPSEWYGGWKRALKYSPIAARKAVGGYEINSNSSGLESVLYKPKTAKGKTVEAVKESPLWAAGKADEIAWGVLWNACEIETSKTTKLERGTEAYYEAVAKLFDKVINETQVVDGVLQRSQIMRSSSGWIKPATAFKGEPIMALNTLIRAYDNLRYETNPAKRGKAIKGFGRAVAVFATSAIFTAFARSLAVGFTGDDDEEYWKKVWKSFSGVQGDEETWFDYVKNVGLKSDAVNNVNPLSWLPIATEMMSALQGYDVERLDVASIGEFVNASTNFINSLDGDGKNTVTYATRNLLLKFSELTGYSPNNLVRDIEGAIRTGRVETNDVRGLYDMEKWRTKPASNVSKYIDILYKAYTTDKGAYKDIYNDLLDNGVSAEKIESGMETRMKKAEGVEKASELTKRYMTPENEKKYDSTISQVKSSHVWKSANAEQKKSAEAYLYSFLTGSSEDMEKMRAEAKALGIDETEYTLWQLAKEVVNKDGNDTLSNKERTEAMKILDLDSDTEWDLYLLKNESKGATYARDEGIQSDTYADFIEALYESDKPSKNGKYGSFTQEEATAAIEMLDGLSRKEKAVLWQSVNQNWKAKNNPFR